MGNTVLPSLTASELGYLWTGYSINEMSLRFLSVFREHAQDPDVKSLFTQALESTEEILTERKRLLSHNGHSIPLGFSEEDINLNSPPLFSDRFLLLYFYVGVQLGLEFHSRSLAMASREDIRKYNRDCLHSSFHLFEQALGLLKGKGYYQQTPSIPPQKSPEKIHKTSYLNGWLGDSRPINSMEMANLYLIMDLLILMETLLTGFVQITSSEEVIELIQKGVTSVRDQFNELAEVLKKDNLPIPYSYAAEISGSATQVFSERIMLSHIAGLFGSLISQYGFSLGAAMKHNLVKTYTTQISKAGTYTEKITRYLIEKEWLEKVPGPK